MKHVSAAICDDEEMSMNLVASSLESCFQLNGVSMLLDRYTSSQTLFETVEKGKGYDLVFLDIDMPGMDGIELAVKLKRLSEKTTVVFVSNCEDRVFESFQAHPFGFVRKSSFLKDIQSVVKLFIESAKGKDHRRLEIKSDEGISRLSLAEIVYIESIRDYQYIHLSGKREPIRLRKSMSEIEKLLEPEGFLRVHQGYIVNYAFISLVGAENIELTNGETVPLSRRKRQEVLERFMRLSRNDGSIFSAT